MALVQTLLVLAGILGLGVTTQEISAVDKVCIGSSLGLTVSASAQIRYNRYRAKYENCTYIDGNLEIAWLDGPDTRYDLSFLSHIREVTGYVLIIGVHSDVLHLEHLRLIRGHTLLNDQYSLYIALNYPSGANPEHIGLKQLGLISLHEILNGDVLISENTELCFEETVIWEDILSRNESRVVFQSNDTEHTTSTNGSGRICPECHEACELQFDGMRHCWGEGPDMCQRLTKLTCHPSCEGQCSGPDLRECCHPECVGGCESPGPRSACWACKNYQNGEQCVAHCPPAFIYDPATYQHMPNPDHKFAYGNLCVDECPSFLYELFGACVSDCGVGMRPQRDSREAAGKCVQCQGPCEKVCDSHGEAEWLTSENIRNFEGCTKVNGRIRILEISFLGDEHNNIPGLHAQDLALLESVEEVTEFIYIDASHEEFRNLSFLRNLQTIWGRQTYVQRALIVFSTSLRRLELTSLQHIYGGGVLIYKNAELCIAEDVVWSEIVEPGHSIIVTDNRDQEQCGLLSGHNESCVSDCETVCHSHPWNRWLTSLDIGHFEGCTKVIGPIIIYQRTFTGDEHMGIPALQMEDLAVLESVEEVTDMIYIEANITELRNLSFLRNLRTILGHQTYLERALVVRGTGIQRLELTSLQHIYGGVLIDGNPELCIAEDVDWSEIVEPGYNITVAENRDQHQCGV